MEVRRCHRQPTACGISTAVTNWGWMKLLRGNQRQSSIALCTEAVGSMCSHLQLPPPSRCCKDSMQPNKVPQQAFMWSAKVHITILFTHAGKMTTTIRILASFVPGHWSTFIGFPSFFFLLVIQLQFRGLQGGQWDIIQTEKSMTLDFAFAWHKEAPQPHWFCSILGTSHIGWSEQDDSLWPQAGLPLPEQAPGTCC